MVPVRGGIVKTAGAGQEGLVMSRNTDSNLTWMIFAFLLFVAIVSPALGYLISNALTPSETQIASRWPNDSMPMQDWTLREPL
jgi:hypothetical protein